MGFPASDAPYPASERIADVEWSERTAVEPSHGDNWPMTWVEDDLQLLAWGDGRGFSDRDPLTLGFAEVRGDPPDVSVSGFESDADTPVGWGTEGRKASGLLQVGDTLYMFVRNARLADDHRNARLAWSTDRGRTFEWADWAFTETFGAPAFVQFGPGYAGARDDHVYVVSQANDDAYEFSPDLVLARVPRDAVPDRDAWEFFAGHGDDGPSWSADVADRRPVFHDPNGTQRVAMTYDAGLDRYLLTSGHEVAPQVGPHGTGFGLFEAPEPWGPWRTVHYDHDFVGGNGENEGAYHYRFPAKWVRDDGEAAWLVYSRLADEHYKFLLRRAEFDV
jgi:hypothetical protein